MSKPNKTPAVKAAKPAPKAAKKAPTVKPTTPAAAPAPRRWATGPKQNHSTVEGPCAIVHGLFADELKRAGDVNKMNRAEVIAAALKRGVNIDTAKTQYQKARNNVLKPKAAKAA